MTKLRPSFTFTEERLAELRAVVPEAFADGRVNWDVLRETLGEFLEPEDAAAEHFGLFWPGKRAARRLAVMPSRGTLAPVPGEGVNEGSTRNLLIEGENLEVLKLLQKSYAGLVKMIYIDPPYNTGNDFVYKDDYKDPLKDYLRKTGQVDDKGISLTTNTRAEGRFHSNWLSMITSRLLLARQLLREDGFIFVSIDDNEVHNLRHVLAEVFGEEAFVATFIWHRRQVPDSRNESKASSDHEYVVCFRRSNTPLRGNDRDLAQFANPDGDARGPWTSTDLTGLATREQRPNLHYTIVDPATLRSYDPPGARGWAISRDKFEGYITEKKILWPTRPDGRPRLKRFASDAQSERTSMSSMLQVGYTQEGTKELQDIFGEKVFQFPKPSSLIQEFVRQATDGQDIVLDFFAGSCTTAHAVWRQNQTDGGSRRFICVQLQERLADGPFETITDVGKERLRRVGKRLSEEAAVSPSGDLGFRVLKLVPSSFRAWENYEGDNIEQLEALFEEASAPLVQGWTAYGLLTEIVLLQGFPLDAKVSQLDAIKRNSVYLVTSGDVGHKLWICLDQRIEAGTLAQVEPSLEDVVVCLETALGDEAKLRLADRCKLETI
jgi:adenine-specific DNA-methyltransferase